MSDLDYDCGHVCCSDPEDPAHRHHNSPMWCSACVDADYEEGDDMADREEIDNQPASPLGELWTSESKQ